MLKIYIFNRKSPYRKITHARTDVTRAGCCLCHWSGDRSWGCSTFIDLLPWFDANPIVVAAYFIVVLFVATFLVVIIIIVAVVINLQLTDLQARVVFALFLLEITPFVFNWCLRLQEIINIIILLNKSHMVLKAKLSCFVKNNKIQTAKLELELFNLIIFGSFKDEFIV